MPLSTLMKKYSLEDNTQEVSTVVIEEELKAASEIEADPEGLVDVENDVKQMENGGITAGLDGQTREIENDLDTEEQTQNAIVAVESYLNFLEDRSSRNLALTDDVARVMRIGLEAISPGLFAGTVVSMEDIIEGELADDADVSDMKEFKERRSNMPALSKGDKATETTKAGLGATLSKLWEAAKKMFWRIANGINDFYNNLATNTTKLKDRIKNLIKESTVLEGNKPFEVRGLEKLSIKGKFVAGDAGSYKAIAAAMEIVLGKVPKAGLAIVKEWESGSYLSMYSSQTTVHKTEELADKLMAEMVRFAKKAFSGLTPVPSSEELPNGFSEKSQGGVFRSDILMGNRAYYGGATTEEQMRRYYFLSTNFSLVPGLESATSSPTDFKTMSSSEAVTALKNVLSLIEKVEDYKVQRNDLNKEIHRISTSEGVRKFGANTDKSFQMRVATLHFAAAIVKNNWQFTGYIIAIAKTLTALVEAMVTAEKDNDVEGQTA